MQVGCKDQLDLSLGCYSNQLNQMKDTFLFLWNISKFSEMSGNGVVERREWILTIKFNDRHEVG